MSVLLLSKVSDLLRKKRKICPFSSNEPNDFKLPLHETSLCKINRVFVPTYLFILVKYYQFRCFILKSLFSLLVLWVYMIYFRSVVMDQLLSSSIKESVNRCVQLCPLSRMVRAPLRCWRIGEVVLHLKTFCHMACSLECNEWSEIN